MPTGLIGYDPARIDELQRRTRLAADHLLHSPAVADPAADHATSVARLVRTHLEHHWLSLLARIATSTAMTGFADLEPTQIHGIGPLPRDGGDVGPPASNSLDSELNPTRHPDAPDTTPAPITTATLPNGWTYQCGPMSATTGQPASGCEWMPSTRWDLLTPLLLAASLAPVTGEGLDAWDCIQGDIPCELIAVPFVSGRGANALDELLQGGARVADTPRFVPLDTDIAWARPETLADHFGRHGPDFGATSPDDYVRQAQEFLAHGVTHNLPTKIDPDTGIIRIYEPATNTFASYNPDGTTATFFKPDPSEHGEPTNMHYWEKQPG